MDHETMEGGRESAIDEIYDPRERAATGRRGDAVGTGPGGPRDTATRRSERGAPPRSAPAESEARRRVEEARRLDLFLANTSLRGDDFQSRSASAPRRGSDRAAADDGRRRLRRQTSGESSAARGRAGAHTPPAPPAAGAPIGEETLVSLVTRLVAPRLALAHGAAATPQRDPAAPAADPHETDPRAAVSGADLVRLIAILTARQFSARRLDGLLQALEARGVAAEDAYLRLLAPAAAQLGQAWCDDTLSFAAVSIGMARLHCLRLRLKRRLVATARVRAPAPRALLASVAADQHDFGLAVVADFLERDGWSVELAPSAGFAARLRAERFDLAALSASNDADIATLSSAIAAARRASANRRIAVMIGGRAFGAAGVSPIELGADATAQDALGAVAAADAVLALVADRC